jgi:hypothetical protein
MLTPCPIVKSCTLTTTQESCQKGKEDTVGPPSSQPTSGFRPPTSAAILRRWFPGPDLDPGTRFVVWFRQESGTSRGAADVLAGGSGRQFLIRGKTL